MRVAPQYVFRTELTTDEGHTYGTAFCAPSETARLVTAGHIVEPGIRVVDQDGRPLNVMQGIKSDKVDVGVVFLREGERACELNPLQWGESGVVGETTWLVGYPGGFTHPVTSNGIVSSKKVDEVGSKGIKITQVHGLPGESGSPVFGPDGKVAGVLIVGTNPPAFVGYVPSEDVKKAIR